MRVARWPDGPGARFQLAVAVLRELDAAHSQGRAGLHLDALSTALSIDPLQIEPILDALVELDWVGRLEEPGNPRHVLLCEPAVTPAQPLLATMLVEPSAGLVGFWRRAGFDAMNLRELLAT
jgi:membrane protein